MPRHARNGNTPRPTRNARRRNALRLARVKAKRSPQKRAPVNKSCLTCGAIGPWGKEPRCAVCTGQQRAKYGVEHQASRERWAAIIASGTAWCWRCKEPIATSAAWDLGHRDGLPSAPEHANCNRSAGARGDT